MKAFGIDFGSMRPSKPRSPRAYLRAATHGYPMFPLITLFGLNAVDELDRQLFGILGPDIRDHFHLSNTKFGLLVSLTLIGGLLIEVPLGYFSDRLPRVRFAIAGAAIWAVFGFSTGLAPTVLVLVFMRIGAGMGRAVVTPTHNSLVADYYPIEARTDAYGVHRLADPIGEFVGAALGGLLAHLFGWRVPFLVFIIPTIVFVLIGTRLREPKRGHFERAAGGASKEVTETDDIPPSFAESIRILWSIGTLRRIWISLPFIAGSLIGFATLMNIYYEDVFGLEAGQRGIVSASGAPLAALGLLLGIPLASRLMVQDPGIGLRLVSVVGVLVGGGFVAIAFAPTLWIAVPIALFIRGSSALILPSVFAALSLAIPPKVRSLGFSMSSVFILPGLLAIVLATYIADTFGTRQGIAFMGPVFFVGALLITTAGKYVKSDINRVWTATATQAEALFERQQGRSKLLLVRGLDVSYGQVQVLFGVNFEVDEGEIVALLGTNGAGKSTLLKTICALNEATNGAVVFDGRDATYAPPNEMAARGVVLMPGGQGVFPSLSVAENLRLAGWTNRRDKDGVAASTAEVLAMFEILGTRLDEPAGNLSGGQQQMLALGMAFIMRPRLLMIDELSLGLAPVVVEQLLGIVARMKADGITIILVEQSVNLALTLAETAFFMEKGEIRFHGPTAELLERPDILRSVFLEGAASIDKPSDRADAETGRAVAVVVEREKYVARLGGHEVRLNVDGVSKRFGGLRALDDVSFTVAPGEIVGFLGPNGAGKTTLFDVISGFTKPDSGTIIIGETNSHDISSLLPHKRARLGLGRSFQDGRLFPTLTVQETIAIALERSIKSKNALAAAIWSPTVTRSERKTNARVNELLELMGIVDFRDKLIRELSTGSKRIVDLACVVAHEPTVLLLDEPSSGIAQREAEALGPLLLDIRDRTRISLLVIEHDVPLMLAIADRMIAMDLGAKIADGDPRTVVHDPEVVRSYLGGGAAVARSGGALSF